MQKQQKYYFFWQGVLSQWKLSFFKNKQGITFNCCEQYMMWRKAILFDDKYTANLILSSASPKEQKQLGRKVKNFDPFRWDQFKREIVYQGNHIRAQQDSSFRTTLISTGNKIIVEASPYDRIWGIGYKESDALKNINNWGENLLGKALMKVRNDIPNMTIL